ncbi:MAG: hypothetical protein A2X28_00935 [Elusimicrobia bacterium GWA2_56_46]|nr:MAG: hypothetical protein A2X28_00935 [Elusimicrobia bacterium GWA2_56_46]OGR55928.1 MAG: hypothetical protein A2X39_06300 [Elusimicrobia bacterium GWC2_56_31]HBB67499.1 hypothetical protein [Elusimicrobiota bacterium]HBW22135.1 hypothetical protein [Elusimicrobiota bacterium]
MENKRRIVIYGGTFDPPHKGHFALIRSALKTLRPDGLYVVPAFRSPFKGLPCASFSERAAMLRDGLKSAGIGRDERVKIHPLEADRGRLTYTWRTVSFFRKEFPGAELLFLMGSDCFETFHRWKNYRRILGSARLVVGAREGFPLKNPEKIPYTRLKGRFPPAASTGLKMGLFAGFDQPGLFKSTRKYISAHGLYAAGLRREAARGMTRARVDHTRAVTLLALELAVKYGADPEKAALAGILHDAARDLGPRGLSARARGNRLKVPAFRETLRKAPIILHAYAGADMAAKKFGVKDPVVLKAIRSHTLGSSSPGLLDKIIYVSDLAADGRDFPEADRIRELAFRDLDAAYAAANYVKLVYILKSGGWIHPESVKTWNNLLENRG